MAISGRKSQVTRGAAEVTTVLRKNKMGVIDLFFCGIDTVEASGVGHQHLRCESSEDKGCEAAPA